MFVESMPGIAMRREMVFGYEPGDPLLARPARSSFCPYKDEP
jgi:hypothetical protein